MSQNDLPDDNAELNEDPDSLLPDSRKRRKKRRIKIRKRVRIKRKTSPKKKARKMLETVAWVLIVAAFIITLVVLVLQLDLSSKHRKKSGDVLNKIQTEQINC